MHDHRRILSAAAFAVAVPLTLCATSASAAHRTAVPYDFDGDGRPQLVVGAPGLDVLGHPGAGGVLAFPTAGSLGPDFQLLTQSTRAVAGASEVGDGFGRTVVSADFDRDGYADLAVGHPYEDSGRQRAVGAVTVVYGSRPGLTGERSEQFFEPDGKVTDAWFGLSLAAGDLNRDGYPDLVVGAGEAKGHLEDRPSGSVTVLYSGRTGLSTRHSKHMFGNRGSGRDEHDVAFGRSVAVGDVDGDAQPDLVVGSGGYEYEEGGGYPGSVTVCLGAKKVLGRCSRLRHDTTLAHLESLAIANVTGSARPEILAGMGGIYDYRNRDYVEQGHLAVLALSGRGSKLAARSTTFDAADAHVGAETAPDDTEFGWRLAAADWNGDGFADLAIGSGPSRSGGPQPGHVYLVRGGREGLSTRGNAAIDLSASGGPADGERSCTALSLLDRDGDGRPDLTIVSEREDVADPGQPSDATIIALLGDGHGFPPTGSQVLRAVDLGLKDVSDALAGASLGG